MSLPIPSESSVAKIEGACGCGCVGPSCAPRVYAAPKECLPSLVYDECEDELVIIGNGKGGTASGTIYREGATCGRFAEDADSDCEDIDGVPVWEVNGTIYVRKSDGQVMSRDPSDGSWDAVSCSPVAEADCFRCVVVELDGDGDATFYSHVRPTIADYREDITTEFCTPV